ncbi:hypothetical protein ACH3XW_4245 [Acanthocheilonema viteae]
MQHTNASVPPQRQKCSKHTTYSCDTLRTRYHVTPHHTHLTTIARTKRRRTAERKGFTLQRFVSEFRHDVDALEFWSFPFFAWHDLSSLNID